MPHQHTPIAAERLAELLGEIDRAMPATGAADGDGDVAAVLAHDLRQPALEEPAHVVQPARNLSIRLQVVDDRRFAAGERPQLRVIVRVGQHAAVEHPVRIQRNAVSIGEGLEEQGERRAVEAEEIADPVLQHARLQLARVDAAAERRDALEEAPLTLDRLGEGLALAREGVSPAGLGKAPEERRLARLEVEHAAVDAARAQLLDVLRQRRQRCAARIDADGGLVMSGFGEEIHRFHQEIGRQVVDAVVAAVFQDFQRDALAGAGESADEHQLHYWSFSICCFWRARNSAVESMPRSLRISLRTAASTSTARLLPAATGIVTLRTVTARMSSDCAVSGRRSAGSRAPGCGRSRWASRRSFILRRTAGSPKMVRMLRRPRPRTSRKSLSIAGQRPSSVPAAMRENSTTSSATSPWPRLISSRPGSLFPTPDSPVISP